MDSSPVYIGACGFSCSEWIEAGVYPAGTRSAEMLGLYSQIFPVVELNYTWYQMIRAETVERMLASHRDLLFCAKLTRTMTHEIAEDWRAQAALYRQGVQPLLDSGRLLSVLMQLPPFFRRTPDNRTYLAHLLDCLHPLPLTVEFRHRSSPGPETACSRPGGAAGHPGERRRVAPARSFSCPGRGHQPESFLSPPARPQSGRLAFRQQTAAV
jgi:uncharacterized protein YecE (DUF72 family)